MDVEQRLEDGLVQLGLPADRALVDRLASYLRLLGQWNRAYNLTRITGPEDMVVRHLLDSLSARPWLAGSRILDAGTGAGLPGIPLALVEPARHFTLVDSVGKKLRFLRQAVLELGLANVTPLQARLEDCPAGSMDTVISRALASLADFAASCGPLLVPGGRLVAMKGRHPGDELAALPAPWRATAVARVQVPGLDAERHIVVLER